MKLEIKCSECGYIVDCWFNGTTISARPCPNCRPAKVEKVTPGYGKIIEVCEHNNYDCKRGVAYSVGARRDGMVLHAGALEYACKPHGIVAKYWRYPGEKEWRD